MTIAAGAQLGPYEIIAPLGAGGMGEVYRARDTRLDREVAIKVLPADFAQDPDRLRRFEQEARATSALNHPNILTVYDFGAHEGAPYLVAELLEGEELRAGMKSGAIPARRALDYAQQIAAGLAAAHAKGITHRDLKPENIFVTSDGRVKILDFGLAKLRPQRGERVGSEVATQKQITNPGTVMGTVGYMSPEQARGLSDVDARSDIFSLGIVLYEMLAGRAPFTGTTTTDVIIAIVEKEPLPLAQHAPDVPAELQRIVSKALRKDREQRYQHVKDLLIDLDDLRRELEFEEKLKAKTGHEEAGVAATATLAPATVTEAPRRTSSAEYIVGEIKRHKLGVGIALMILVVVVVTGLGYGLYKLIGQNQAPSRAAGSAPRVVPFTSFPGRENYPAFSPDGNQLAFAWSGEGGDNTDIYVKLIDAGTPLRLTTNAAEDVSPVWSPDGRYLAFVRLIKNVAGIYLVPALGGPERELLSATARGGIFVTSGRLSWSPDGKSLAFVGAEGIAQDRLDIFLLSVESLEKRQLTFSSETTLYGPRSPVFSPDGQTLAFSDDEIYLVPTVGGTPRRLTSDRREIRGLAWTPDGRELVFSSNRAGSLSLWKIPASGGTPEPLTSSGEQISNIAIARQGNRLAYTQLISDSNIWRIETSGATGKRNPPVKLISSTRQEVSPKFSADGKRIVFTSSRSGNQEIWVCDSEGLNLVQLTSFNGPSVGSPRWSPDRLQVAFDCSVDGQWDIYAVSAGGGKPRRLTVESSSDVRPSWSRDGQWIYFGSNRTGEFQVWKMPAAGGQAVQVTRQGGREAFESPDSQSLYYTKGSGIWRTPVAGGEETLVLDQVPWGAWALLDQGIYFINFQASPRPAIEFFSFATTRRTQIAVIEKELANGFAVSPDGRWVLWSQIDRSESDIMLMENFR